VFSGTNLRYVYASATGCGSSYCPFISLFAARITRKVDFSENVIIRACRLWSRKESIAFFIQPSILVLSDTKSIDKNLRKLTIVIIIITATTDLYSAIRS